jgi:5,6,7,8-tetrahydromethanopterin hydro-lyase
VFIHWDANDDNKIYDYNYKATKESIARALGKKPTVDEVIASSKSAKHPYSPK